MFCRRFSSCILLIIIVLSFSRTPIIANAAKASAQENDTTPTDVSVNAVPNTNVEAVPTLHSLCLARMLQTENYEQFLNELVENIDQSEHAASVMIRLSQIVKSESLPPDQVDEILSMLETLIKFVSTSKDAVLVMKPCSDLIIKFYSSLRCLMLNLRDDITWDKVKQEGHRLFGIMSELCKKVDDAEDVPSSIETLSMVAKRFKEVYISILTYTPLPQREFIIRTWKEMTENHFNQILRGMQCLSERIDDAKYAESMMTKLMHNFVWNYAPTNQLEILIHIMKHLININGFDKSQFTYHNSSFLAMQKCLTSGQIDRILSMLKDSITKVNEPKKKISVINYLFLIIEIRNSRQGLDDFSSSQINLILRMVKFLIESVDDIDTALEIKSNFTGIYYARSALLGGNDNEQLLNAIMSDLDQRYPDINA